MGWNEFLIDVRGLHRLIVYFVSRAQCVNLVITVHANGLSHHGAQQSAECLLQSLTQVFQICFILIIWDIFLLMASNKKVNELWWDLSTILEINSIVCVCPSVLLSTESYTLCILRNTCPTLSYLHILSNKFRRCVTCWGFFFSILKFEFLPNHLVHDLAHHVLWHLTLTPPITLSWDFQDHLFFTKTSVSQTTV